MEEILLATTLEKTQIDGIYTEGLYQREIKAMVLPETHISWAEDGPQWFYSKKLLNLELLITQIPLLTTLPISEINLAELPR